MSKKPGSLRLENQGTRLSFLIVTSCLLSPGSTILQTTNAQTQVPFNHVVIDNNGPSDPWGKSIGDINGDGLIDLITGGRNGGGLVWYENPLWTKHTIASGSGFSTDHEVADLDQDGDNDVVSLKTDQIIWYENPSWTAFTIDTNVLHDLEIADFDADGKLDIVARDQAEFGHRGDTLFFYAQNSPTSWTRSVKTIPNGEGLRVADVNTDGKPDIIINGSWYENTGTITSWTEHSYTTSYTHRNTFVDVGDINADGRLDIVLSPAELAGQTYRLSWFEAPVDPTSGSWAEHIVEGNIEAVHHFVGTGDVDNDGDVDIASAEMTQGSNPDEVKLYINEGDGESWTKQVLATTGSHSMRLVDIDNDGDQDIYGANYNGALIELWENVTSMTIPMIVTHPLTQGVIEGQTATFSVVATGDQPLSFQWQKDSIDIPGATGALYTTPTTTLSDSGAKFRCTVTNAFGSTTSNNATVIVSPFGLRVSAGQIVLYTFEEGSGTTINDTAGFGEPLNVYISDESAVTWIPGGISIDSSTIINSPTAATKVFDAAQASNEITVEAWIRPANTTQNGPARIVTLSPDASSRNFTLGQGVFGGPSDVYDARLRTTATSTNGTPSLTTPAGTLTTELTNVVFTRDASDTTRFYVNGVEQASGLVCGDFSNWESSYPLALGNEPTGNRPWLGELHLVAIYNRALSSDEIEQNYELGPDSPSILSPQRVRASLRVLLEGPYQVGADTMSTDLAGLLPMNQPYNMSPWNHTGSESVASIPSGVVDWVLVELRSDTSSLSTVATRAAFIKTNGTIVDLDGSSPVSFQGISAGDYYTVIRHRNHLAIMSATPLSLSTTSTLYDFTTAQSQAYGSSSMAQVDGGVFAMYAGDGNSSAIVTAADANAVFGELNATGYTPTDINMSGIVTAADANAAFGNLDQFTQVP